MREQGEKMWKEKWNRFLKKQKTAQSEPASDPAFSRADFAECKGAVQNPGCGWYHLYTFDAAKTDEPLYLACKEEELVLLRIGIGAFRTGRIPQESMAWVRKILAFFRDQKKGMILRFAYDLEGKGLEREPGSIKTVQEHMRQLGAAIREFSEDIYVVQGILIGNWGEMHGSRYLTPDGFRTLVRTMQDALEGACPLAVRRPSQWRELARNFTEEEKKYLTLYNDGMFGSETDLGTYGTLAMETPEQEPQSRGAELDWQRTAMRGRFCGGEAVQRAAGEENVSAEEAIRDLEKMHISYLNSTYGKCGNSFKKRESHVENGGRFFRSDELDADYPGKPRICRADGRSRLLPGDRRGEQKEGNISDPYRCQNLEQWRNHRALPTNQTACGGRTKKNVSGIIPQAGWASAPVCQSECGKRACVSGHVSEQLFQRQCSEPESVRIMGKRVGRLDFPPK